jgi:uncharacterized protein YkwD
MTMNTADIIILFIILLSAFTGYKKGFIYFSTVCIKWCGSVAAPFFLAPIITNVLRSEFQVQELWLFITSFIVLFLITFGVLSVAESWLLFYTKKTTHAHWFNKTTGVIGGLAAGLLLTTVSYHIIHSSYWEEGNEELNESFFATNYRELFGTSAEDMVNTIVASVEGLQVAGATTTDPSSKKEIFQTMKFNSDASKELQLLELVNSERSLRKLSPLRLSDELSQAARLHGADMFTRGYFSHNTPEGKDPFQRLNTLNISYKYAGENLAYSYTITRAHIALMKSPGHRANILNPKFSRIGISVLNGGNKGLIIVQEFKN